MFVSLYPPPQKKKKNGKMETTKTDRKLKGLAWAIISQPVKLYGLCVLHNLPTCSAARKSSRVFFGFFLTFCNLTHAKTRCVWAAHCVRWASCGTDGLLLSAMNILHVWHCVGQERTVYLCGSGTVGWCCETHVAHWIKSGGIFVRAYPPIKSCRYISLATLLLNIVIVCCFYLLAIVLQL